jgi:hypothetical protein
VGAKRRGGSKGNTDDKGRQHKRYERRYCKSTFGLAFNKTEESKY